MHKFLVIQTAFIGDTILATAVLEAIYKTYPIAQIDILVRQGNQSLFDEHPFINKVLVWDKTQNKYNNLWAALKVIRASKYTYVINLQRFLATGFLTAFAGAKTSVGFAKNPLSFLFTKRLPHTMDGRHEIERNQSLLDAIGITNKGKVTLYPTQNQINKVNQLTQQTLNYVVMAPSSVWYTKQLPKHKWVELIKSKGLVSTVYIIGSKADKEYCNGIISEAGTGINLCGELTFLESAALMQNAQMTYLNDSAPLHLASAVNAPITAFFCSTVPSFGFYPLSTTNKIAQVENLDCRPCGLHGYKQCPKGHFKCGNEIAITNL